MSTDRFADPWEEVGGQLPVSVDCNKEMHNRVVTPQTLINCVSVSTL